MICLENYLNVGQSLAFLATWGSGYIQRDPERLDALRYESQPILEAGARVQSRDGGYGVNSPMSLGLNLPVPDVCFSH